MSSLPHAVTGAQRTLHASHSGKWHRETTLPRVMLHKASPAAYSH